MVRMSWLRFALAAVVLGVSTPAFAAKPCSDRTKECGGKLFDAGVKAFQAGNYETALEHFREAYAIAKLPVVTFNLALAEDKLGQYEGALAHLEEVLADSSTNKATREKAEAERDRITRSLAVIAVELAGARNIQIEIDGKTRQLENGAVRVMPGLRSVRVTADGAERLSRSVRVEAGERLVLHIERTRELVVESGGDKPTGAPAEKDEPTKGGGGVSPAWFFVAAGVTVVLGGITVWSGLDTVSAKNDLDDDRPKLTLAEEQDRIDEGHAKETRTNVFLVATGVGAVATAALGLFVVSWGKGKNDNVAVGINGSMASVSGRF
jgi:hypothetical protein